MKVVRIVLAWISAVVSMVASVTGLWHVAYEVAEMPLLAAGAVVAGFDVSAVTAGLKVVERPKHVPSWVLLGGLAAVSAGAQILASPDHLGWWRLLHGAPPVTAIWTLHGAVADGKPEGKKSARSSAKDKDKKDKDRVARSVAGAASTPVAPPSPPGQEARGDEIGMAPPVDLAARRKGRRRPTETGAAPLSPEDLQRVEDASKLLLAEGASRATRRDIERVLGVGNRVAGRLLPAVNEAMAARRKLTAGADND